MTIEKAIEVLENGEFWNILDPPCGNKAVLEFLDALDVVIAAASSPNDPLTLDELRICFKIVDKEI